MILARAGPDGMTGAAVVVIDSGWVAVLLRLSVTLTVKLVSAGGAVAVPVIAPVDGFRLAQPGSDPELMLHVYGRVPPLAPSVAEYGCPRVPSGRLVVRMTGVDDAGRGICDAIARPVRT